MRLKYLKPVLTLVVITPFLTELLTTNVSLTTILRPRVFFLLATVGYGFAVLALRELAIRMRSGVVGLVLLGLIYGIYNEGFIAKTFLLRHGVPINTFDGYGLYGGIEIGWAIAITTWHAFFAFLFPIVIVYSLYPGERYEPWLGRVAVAVLAAITLIISALSFLGKNERGIVGTPGQYAVLMLVAGLLYALARRYCGVAKIVEGTPQSGRLRSLLPAALGFATELAIILVPALLAAMKIPIVLYCGYFLLLAGLALCVVSIKGDFALNRLLTFVFGGQIAVALFALAAACKHHSAESVFSSSVFVTGFACLLLRQIRRLSKPGPFAAKASGPS
jgi:hypothetical protein